MVISTIGLLSVFAILVAPLALTLPIGRFGGLLAALGYSQLLPLSRERKNAPQQEADV